MCDWSNWQFLCDGRYDILLALLTGLALLSAISMVVATFFGAKYRARHQKNHPYKVSINAARAAILGSEAKASHNVEPDTKDKPVNLKFNSSRKST